MSRRPIICKSCKSDINIKNYYFIDIAEIGHFHDIRIFYHIYCFEKKTYDQFYKILETIRQIAKQKYNTCDFCGLEIVDKTKIQYVGLVTEPKQIYGHFHRNCLQEFLI